MHCAAWHGYVPIVRIFCENGAMLSLQNKEKETALHCAAVRGNIDCVRILLENQAPLNVTDKRGSTPLHLACQRHNAAIALLILNAGCKLDIIDKETGESALHCAAREGLLHVVQTLCSLGADVDQVTEDGLTPLHLACKSGHIEIARSLLFVGANPDAVNKDGVTGEIMALAQGYTNIAELLNSVKGEKRLALISQLKLSPQPIPRVKLKLLGSTGVGKSTLVESLKCGFLGSFFRRRTHAPSPSVKSKTRSRLSRQFSLPTPLNYTVGNPSYTKGIDVQNITISGTGEWSIWDFSGYEPYYMLYDHFLGDVHCAHVVMFNLQDSLDEQMAQVVFWLNFLKARIHPKMPIDHCGKLQNTGQVVLVATHADKATTPTQKSSSGSGLHTSEDAQYILEKVLTMFQYDLDICPQVYVMDTQLPSSVDMRAFKHQLGKMRKSLSDKIPRSNGFLSAVVAQLPEWRKALASYPVLSWPQFSEHVRGCVNPLASDEDVKLLDRQLQLMGEIVYLHSHTDLVVVSPRWLGVDVLGHIMSHERIAQARVIGCFSLDEFQLMYPSTDALSLLQVLEALEMCTPCEVDGDVEYEFPCLNFVEALEGLWLRDEKRFQSPVYGGVRLHTSFQSGAQLKYLFPRIQVCLRRSILSGDEEQEEEGDSSGDEEHRVKEEQKDADLYQWHHGSKYCCARLEGIIDMDRNEQFLEIKVRGPEGERANLYYFLEDFVNIVEQVVENVCPGLCVERYTLSPSQLSEHGKVVRSYSPTELLRMQLENRSSVVLSGNLKEDFIDIACLGSEEILETVTLGMDLPISHLTVHTQRLLSLLLDPPEAMGKDWCLLAVSLGLSDALPSLEATEETGEGTCVSQTQKVLSEWTRRHNDASIRQLVYKLKEISRLDAVEAILRTGPPFKVLSFEDQMTDSTGTHGTNASTNTLSNLSR
ncbi:death-associated protein kinase dapk-1 [Aplysia californica]|uniref:Death-associated protein kinase dapk-1 n=1 Tax=Aplysia californica TaxID=6500 RepID=A0ABM0K454_APLCA|nr:death-associated protein kinase dapk-1 [Aplysia californica]